MKSEYMAYNETQTDSGIASPSTATRTMPFRTLVSRQAQKTYLGVTLFAVTLFLMLFVSSIAYGIFYYYLIPQVRFERVIHLQFGSGENPWGIASVEHELASLQPYNVDVILELPRTSSNLAAGNFMLDVILFSRTPTPVQTDANIAINEIARSRRPGILTYMSPMVDTAHRLSLMPLYVLGWRREAETVQVRMMEDMEFPRGWRNLPQSLRLEIHSDVPMQIYSARVRFQANLSGLRWIMYNWWLSSLLAFTFLFWSISMLSTGVVWIVLTFRASDSHGAGVKEEQHNGMLAKESDYGEGKKAWPRDSDSDSLNSQQKKVKEEFEEELHDIPVSEVAGSHTMNTGAATGLETSAATREIQRRRSRQAESEVA